MWRREKPEFWGTKKAYSPIRILRTKGLDFAPGLPLGLPVYNRFDHTNLNEVTVRFTYEGKVETVEAPSVWPHQKGLLRLPARDWKSGDEILVEFLAADGMLIDAERISLGGENLKMAEAAPAGAPLSVEETPGRIVVKGADFEIPFDKATGLIRDAVSHGQVVIEKGPFLNLDLNVSHKTGPEVREKAKNYIVADADWTKEALSYHKESDGSVRVELSGRYKGIRLAMDFAITPDGAMNLYYQTEGEPNGWLRESGVKFYLPEAISCIDWEREAYWSYYPENSFAGNRGSAPLYNPREVPYGADPAQPWIMDTRNYYYFADKGALGDRPLTNVAKGMKENIRSYTLRTERGEAFEVCSPNASLACRLNKLQGDRLILYVNTRWDYPEIAWGDYCKALEVCPNAGTIQLRF